MPFRKPGRAELGFEKKLSFFFLSLIYVFCYYHILFYTLVSFFYKYMVVFLFNTVMYVFLLVSMLNKSRVWSL